MTCDDLFAASCGDTVGLHGDLAQGYVWCAMTTFVLLHGAWHGGWCWADIQAALAARGHRSVAPDMPSGEPDAGARRHADIVAEAVAGISDDLVVVPHSLAGLYAPIAAREIGAVGVVNLAALTPEPGSSGLQQAKVLPGIYRDAYRTAPMTRHDDGSTSVPREIADEFFFHDCAAYADGFYPRLRRQFWAAWVEPCPLDSWPDSLAYAHVACVDDRVLGEEGMRDGAARTRAPLTWIPGGHLPMLSHPEEAAAALCAAVEAW